jgi:hypothetical protein
MGLVNRGNTRSTLIFRKKPNWSLPDTVFLTYLLYWETIVFQNDDKYMAERESNMKRNCVLLTIVLTVLALTASQVMAHACWYAPSGGPGQGGFWPGGVDGNAWDGPGHV